MTNKQPETKPHDGMIGIPPQTWETLKMVTIKEPIHEFEKIYWSTTVPCPWVESYVHPAECHRCNYSKKGSWKEKWTICSFKYDSEHPVAEEEDVRT